MKKPFFDIRNFSPFHSSFTSSSSSSSLLLSVATSSLVGSNILSFFKTFRSKNEWYEKCSRKKRQLFGSHKWGKLKICFELLFNKVTIRSFYIDLYATKRILRSGLNNTLYRTTGTWNRTKPKYYFNGTFEQCRQQ